MVRVDVKCIPVELYRDKSVIIILLECVKCMGVWSYGFFFHVERLSCIAPSSDTCLAHTPAIFLGTVMRTLYDINISTRQKLYKNQKSTQVLGGACVCSTTVRN